MKKNIFAMMILLSSLTIASGQPGYEEYRYIKGNNTGNEVRMSRANIMKDRHVTGQPGYAEYRYTQGDTTKVIMKD